MNNSNLIKGTAGTGMNYLAKMIIIRKALQGEKITIIDTNGEYGALSKQFPHNINLIPVKQS